MPGTLLSCNDFLLPNLSSNYESKLFLCCFIAGPSSYLFTSYNVVNSFFLLPLCIIILHQGLHQCWQKRSTTSAAALSHSDCCTYHMVIIDLIGVLGCIICCFSVYEGQALALEVGIYVSCLSSFGKMLFQILMCMERYLAVVHPVIYLSLKKERGIRVRNTSMGCAWLLAGTLTLMLMRSELFTIVNFFILLLSFTFTSFCSVSVLHALISPGPGKQIKGRKRVEQSKRRAFNVILIILGALLIRFICSLVWIVMFEIEENPGCMLVTSESWFQLPSSLVLPLLFLHKEGKLSTFQTCKGFPKCSSS